MPFNIGAPELIIILVIALLIIGPGKLPDVGQALGKSLREFRKASSDVQEAVKVDTSPLPSQAAAASSVPAAPAQPAPAQPAPAQPAPNTVSDAATPNTLAESAASAEQPATDRS